MANNHRMPLLENERTIMGELKQPCPKNEFMGMKQAAEFLQLSVSSMQKISARRTIPVYKPSNGKVYFKKEDLLNYLNAGRQTTTAPKEKEVNYD